MENQDNKYKDWDVLVKKIVTAKVKVALRPILYIREIHQHCPWKNRPVYTITAFKAQGQGFSIKDLCTKNLKPNNSSPGLGSKLGP